MSVNISTTSLIGHSHTHASADSISLNISIRMTMTCMSRGTLINIIKYKFNNIVIANGNCFRFSITKDI